MHDDLMRILDEWAWIDCGEGVYVRSFLQYCKVRSYYECVHNGTYVLLTTELYGNHLGVLGTKM